MASAAAQFQFISIEIGDICGYMATYVGVKGHLTNIVDPCDETSCYCFGTNEELPLQSKELSS